MQPCVYLSMIIRELILWFWLSYFLYQFLLPLSFFLNFILKNYLNVWKYKDVISIALANFDGATILTINDDIQSFSHMN